MNTCLVNLIKAFATCLVNPVKALYTYVYREDRMDIMMNV